LSVLGLKNEELKFARGLQPFSVFIYGYIFLVPKQTSISE